MPDFIDYLGNPIREGDYYTHPVANGSSAATLNFGRIAKIIPLVQVIRGQGRKVWTLDEYANRSEPTEYRPIVGTRRRTGPTHRDFVWEPDMRYAYVVRSMRLDHVITNRDGDYENWQRGWRFNDAPKGRILKNIDRLVVVTDILGPEWSDRVAEAESFLV